MIAFQIHFNRHQHTQYFFFVHFHAAANRTSIRWGIFSGGSYQIFFAKQQARTLRPANAFSSRKTNQIKTHLRVFP